MGWVSIGSVGLRSSVANHEGVTNRGEEMNLGKFDCSTGSGMSDA